MNLVSVSEETNTVQLYFIPLSYQQFRREQKATGCVPQEGVPDGEAR